VFRAGDVIIRVAPQSADVSGQVALANRLLSEGFPVAAPLAEPDEFAGAKVSVWEYVHADERPTDFRQLGEIVARRANASRCAAGRTGHAAARSSSATGTSIRRTS
jgi:hypothetical protein